MFNKREKKLSEEDLKNWDRLKKTLDFKFYNKPYQITELKKNKQLSKKQKTDEQYRLRQNKSLKQSKVNPNQLKLKLYKLQIL